MQANSDIPLEATRLGALVSTHRVEFSKRIWGYIVLLGLGIPFLIWGLSLVINGTRFAQLPFLITGAVMCLWGLWSVFFAWRKGYPPHFGKSDASDSTAMQAMNGSWFFAGGLIVIIGALISIGLVIAAFGLFMAVLPIWSSFMSRRNKGRIGYLFSEGYCYINAQGKPQTFRWDETESIWVWPTAQNIIMTVQLQDGRKLEFGDPWLKDYRALTETIEECITEKKMPDAQLAFDKGSNLNFGPITLSSGGLITDSERVTLEEIDLLRVSHQPSSVEAGAGTGLVRRGIEITRGSKKRSLRGVTIADIPNFRLLMRLLQRIGKAAEPFY